jgi:DNA-binding transcriptional MerR regulator/GGDEF domain-containing protein
MQRRAKLREHLNDAEVQRKLRQALQHAQGHLTASIGQVAGGITHLTPVQLRYLETLKLLTPSSRAELGANGRKAGNHPGPRRYSLQDLNRLLVIQELLSQGASLEEIGDFLERNESLVEEIARGVVPQEPQHRQEPRALRELIGESDQALFWRGFLPGVLYIALCLLFESAISGDMGLLLPMQADPVGSTQQGELEPEDLASKPFVLGWYSKRHPFCTFLLDNGHDRGQLVKFLEHYYLTPLRWTFDDCPAPITVYLATERPLTSAQRAPGVEARTAAGRLLRLVQEQLESWKPYLQSGGEYLVSQAPDTTDPAVKQYLLSAMAEQVVRLGGHKPGSTAPRWRFASIFLPTNPLAPLQQRSLVVQGKSAHSPHQIGSTTIGYRSPVGLSQIAFQSGQMCYRSRLAGALDIGLWELEGRPGSALAMPIEGDFGQAIGVLYIVAEEPESFSQERDWLVLRLMARLIGQVVQTTQTRDLLVSHFPEVIAHPELVDRFFSDFATDSQLAENLEQMLETIKHESAPSLHDLSFVAINIDKVNQVSSRYGEAGERNLVRAVGKRLRQRGFQQGTDPIELYYICADRFYLVLKNMPLAKAETYARNLWEVLCEYPYQIEAPRLVRGQYPPGLTIEQEITVHLAVTGYTYETLKHMLLDQAPSTVRARLIQALYEGLNLGRDKGGDTLVVWNLDREQFMSYPSKRREQADRFGKQVEATLNAGAERVQPPASTLPDTSRLSEG